MSSENLPAYQIMLLPLHDYWAWVEAAKDVPGRVRLLGRLRALKVSLAAGKSLPKDVKLVVIGVGGQSTSVTGRLQSEGVDFRHELAPKSRPRDWLCIFRAAMDARAF